MLLRLFINNNDMKYLRKWFSKENMIFYTFLLILINILFFINRQKYNSEKSFLCSFMHINLSLCNVWFNQILACIR